MLETGVGRGSKSRTIFLGLCLFTGSSFVHSNCYTHSDYHTYLLLELTPLLQAVLSGADLVIHAAGPFQRSENHTVLQKAIEAKVAYLDVCDDMDYSERCARAGL